MAEEPRKMAKLNNDSSTLQFAAAVTAMSIGTGKRLIRNFHYYRQETAEVVSKPECLHLYREIRLNLFGLQNLYLDDVNQQSDTGSSFKVMLAKQIQDNFEDLHRKILFFDADSITDLIPIIDRQRSFWKESTEPQFYESDLPIKIDRHLSTDFPAMEQYLHSLPDHSDKM